MDPDIVKFFWVMAVLAVTGGVGFIFIAVGAAIAKRIERKGIPDEELAFLRDQIEEVEDLRDRVAELESRVDFAERMLSAPNQTNASSEVR